MSADFSLLASSILIEICDYCEAQDIMALHGTCVSVRTLLDENMLVVDGEIGCDDKTRRIPVFDTDHCHSVLLICRLRTEKYHSGHTIVVESRPRHANGRFTTVVCQKFVHSGWRLEVTFFIGFRNDPSQEYQLRHDLHDYNKDGPIFTVRKQFMTRPVTPTRKRAIAACFAMVNTRAPFLRDASNVSGPDMIRLFMKLFVLSYASYPIYRFLATYKCTGWRERTIPQPVVDFFERVLEQNEPMDCVKKQLAFENSPKYGARWYYIRLFHLKFRWKDGEANQTHEEEGIRFHDGLEFMARIPLIRKTRDIYLVNTVDAAHFDLPLLVVFFQKRQSDLNPLENPIDGHVFTLRRDLHACSRRFAVKPEYEECFLYFVPNNASRTVIVKIKVELEVDQEYWWFSEWLDLLLGPWHNSKASVHDEKLPLILFRACALDLLGPNAQRYTAWKDAFDMEKLDSTPRALQCLVESADELLNCNCVALSTTYQHA